MPKGKELRGSLLWRKGRPELQNEDPHLNCLSDAKRQEIVWRKGWLKLQCTRHKVCQKKENSVLLYFWFCFSVINENIEKGKSPLPNRDTVLQRPQLDYRWLTVEINEHYLQKILDDFNFGQKKCPKLKLSEILKRPNFWACEMFTVQYETFK